MIIGIISDTHNQLESMLIAMRFFKQQAVDLIIHGGDWTTLDSAKFLAREANGIPIIGVLGNNDKEFLLYPEARKSLEPIITLSPEPYLEQILDGAKCAVIHGDNKTLVNELIQSQKYDVVICGHTHRPMRRTFHNTLVINPGSTAFSVPRFIPHKHVALFNTLTRKARIVTLPYY